MSSEAMEAYRKYKQAKEKAKQYKQEQKEEQIKQKTLIESNQKTIDKLEQQLKKIEIQNKNQAEIITHQSKSLNKQAIKLTHAQEQNEKLSNDFHHHKHIVCRSVDCNEMSGEIEHGTNEFNQML